MRAGTTIDTDTEAAPAGGYGPPAETRAFHATTPP